MSRQPPPDHDFGPGLLVVVAHPDDEVLWLGAVLPRASKIVAALPGHIIRVELASARRKLHESYPIPGLEFLALSSAGVAGQSDRLRPGLVDHGVSLADSCPADRAEHYRSNFARLVDALDPYVADSSTVFTHNPWGEYGHEEHIQVSRAVLLLAQRHRRSVWAWEGFSKRYQLANRTRTRADYFPDDVVAALPSIELEVDLDLFRQVRDLYLRHGAWTWANDYLPASPSRYVQLAREGTGLVRQARPPKLREARIAVQLITAQTKRFVRAAQTRSSRRQGGPTSGHRSS
jgi:LmbE family N-acetylglucosaminyl deacetylase